MIDKPIKGRNLDTPLGVKVIDSLETYSVPRPKRIAGKIPWRIKAKDENYKTVHCMACFLPSLWFDNRIRHQINVCVHCDTPHEMIVKGGGEVKKRIINKVPDGYNERIPVHLLNKKRR